jgi:hypothetical protein
MLPVFFKVAKLHILVDVRLVEMIHELKDFGVLDRAAAISMTPQGRTSP